MEEDNLVTHLSKLADKFQQTERLHKETNPQYLKWIDDISQSDYKLICNLIVYFKEDETLQPTKEVIIYIILKLLLMKYDRVNTQLLSSSFIQSLIKYINNADQSNLNQNVYHLITILLTNDILKDYLKEDLIIGLLNGLRIITDNKIIQNIIYMIQELSSLYPQGYKNGVLKVLHSHHNARLFNELLLGIFHNEKDKKKQVKLLQLINAMYQKEKKATFLKVNLEDFIDILIVHLHSLSQSHDVRIALVKSFEVITKDEEYYNDSQYKIQNIIDIMDDMKSNEYHPENLRDLCKEVMNNITKFLSKKSK